MMCTLVIMTKQYEAFLIIRNRFEGCQDGQVNDIYYITTAYEEDIHEEMVNQLFKCCRWHVADGTLTTRKQISRIIKMTYG